MKRNVGPPMKYVAVGDQVFPAGPARDQQFVRPFLIGATADKVLAHKPKPKSKPARKRARRAKKIAQATDSQ